MTLSAETAAPAFTNRLAREKSPYLLQHAHNPVEWHPWGEAAFAKARKENKPIFLSIGYSTCHWCHVMERESFEDPEVARQLNRDFVSIKVDREERPDVDSVYMTYVQATTGGGGWPMSVWLTPQLKPFFGGTYFPREDVSSRPGFKTLLRRISEAWRADRDGLEASGESAVAQLQAATERPQTGEPADAGTLDNALAQFEEAYDPVNGGFGVQPKFPRPSVLHFLFRHYARTGSPKPLDMALHTLRCMADGGIHDRLGGGFHRYAVDARWHVPHFEKMLYDQAQLAMAALDAFQITRDPFFESLTRDILEYVRRDLTGQEGQFYSAEDADSQEAGRADVLAEGAFYVWEAREIKEALGDKRAAIFCRHYGVRLDGNAAETVAPELRGKNILSVAQTLEETATAYGATADEVKRILDQARLRLLEVRSARPRPRLDDKAVTAWNGLMISAFARACQVLGDPVYRDLAERAALFIRNRLSRENGEFLWRRYRDGEAAVDGGSADYAFVIQALLDLYETLFDPSHLNWALALQDRQNRLFWDQKQGGYFDTAADPRILLRLKESYDGAEPSANSVSASNLIRLHHLSPGNGFDKRAELIFAAFSKTLQEAPDSAPQLLAALELRLAGISQVVIAGRRDAPDTQDMMKALRRTFLPGALTLLVDPGKGVAELARRAPYIRDMTMIDDKATAYVCRNFSCRIPTTDSRVMLEQLTQRPDPQAVAQPPPPG